MAEKKKFIRRLMRINGKLQVVFVDLATGQIITNLDGYEEVSHEGFEGAPEITPEDKNEPEPTPSSDNDDDDDNDFNFFTDSEWANRPTRSKGTGDIIGDFKAAGGELKNRVDSLFDYVKDGVLTTVGKAFGQSEQAQDVAKDAIRTGVDKAAETVGNIGSTIGNIGSNIFGGGSTQTAGINWNGKDQNLTPEVRQAVETAAGNLTFGLTINSGFRNDEHNRDVGGAPSSEHLHGNAVDISIEGLNDPQKSALVHNLVEAGFTRIGAYSGNTSIHADRKPVDPPDGYIAWPMFDRTINNMGSAPSWFSETMQGRPLPEAQQYSKAPIPGGNQVAQTPPAPQQRPVDQPIIGDSMVSRVSPDLLNAVAGVKAQTNEPVIVEGKPIPPEIIQTEAAKPEGDLQALIDSYQGPVPHSQSGYDGPIPVTPGDPVQAQTRVPPVPADPALRPAQTAVEATEQLASSNGLDPIQNAYLAAIHYAEGSPKMNQAFGYKEFELGPNHPNTFNSEFNTSAAGKYQWTTPTWNEFSKKAGVNDFSNETHQDLAAWTLASENYRTRTGRNLHEDLASGDPDLIAQAFSANSNRWSSLPSGLQERTSREELLDVYNSNLTTDRPRSNFRPDTESFATRAMDTGKNTEFNRVERTSSFMTPNRNIGAGVNRPDKDKNYDGPSVMRSRSDLPDIRGVNEDTFLNAVRSAKDGHKQSMIKSQSKETTSENFDYSKFMSKTRPTPAPIKTKPQPPLSNDNDDFDSGFTSRPTKTKNTQSTTKVKNTSSFGTKDKDKYNGYSYNPSGR